MSKRKRSLPSNQVSKNKFCRSSDLTNEASVESFFVLRLLKELGYEDSEIRTKQSIESLKVSKGRRQGEPYRPDFVLVTDHKPRWLVDAKAIDERIEKYTYQCSNYSLQINQRFVDSPLRFYMLTNGLLTRVYPWDKADAVLSLRFKDFVDGNTKYETLKNLLSVGALEKSRAKKVTAGRVLKRPAMEEIKKAFLRCHRIIWKSEKMSPQAAFVAFAKLLFVKLWEDRRLKENADMLTLIANRDPIPKEQIRFSTEWIEDEEFNAPNPIDAILFRQLVESLEKEIAERKRKRIFEPNEQLSLSPGTVKRVVEELQNYYLFGIDEDLNGRMFETFLTATMRGQELGQLFTPRSIVKLMTRMASLKAEPEKIEKIIDGCCGTGGFLIEALTEMRQQIWQNNALTERERQGLLDNVANQAIFGIDAGKDPPITRIARINMYLHGDGGSRIYRTDGLRNVSKSSGADTVEVEQEVKELRTLLSKTEFDVVLTNPPFSMDYSMRVPDEKEILEDYELVSFGGKKRNSLRSSVMFIERYWNLLKAGGRLLTVIDDSVLAGKQFPFVRDFIRERFIIKAVISLHGDAFRRAGARAKTSILYLVKKHDESEKQSACFVKESRYIGLDDVPPKTRQSDAERARELATKEMEEIASEFKSFMSGQVGSWLVLPDKLNGRLDAKYLRPWSTSELKPKWDAVGADSTTIEKVFLPIEEEVSTSDDVRYTFLRITYQGRPERGDSALGKEITYPRVFKAKQDDIIISTINAVNRATCVMPSRFENLLVSPAFIILRLKPEFVGHVDPVYVWSILRTSAVTAEWLSSTTGFGRHWVDWELVRKQQIPLLKYEKQKHVGDIYRALFEAELSLIEQQAKASEEMAPLCLEDDRALDRLQKAKPPR